MEPLPRSDLTPPADWGFLMTPSSYHSSSGISSGWGRVVLVEKPDDAAVHFVRNHCVELQVTVPEKVGDLPIVEHGFSVVYFTSRIEAPHLSRNNSRFTASRVPPNPLQRQSFSVRL